MWKINWKTAIFALLILMGISLPHLHTPLWAQEEGSKKSASSTDSKTQAPLEISRSQSKAWKDKIDFKLEGPFPVAKIVDGDTVHLGDKDIKKVRLIGLNAPEKKEPLSYKSTSVLRRIINKSPVYVQWGKEKKDRYGRYLAYLYIKEGNRYLFVNLRMVELGMAISFPHGEERRYEKTFDAFEKRAQEKKLGIWAIEYPWARNKVRVHRKRESYYKKSAYTKAKNYPLALPEHHKVFLDKAPKGLSERAYQVVKIYDGDTVRLRDGRKIRLLSIDCPERKIPFYGPSKKFLRKVIKGRKVYVLYGKDKKDRYGRFLAHLFVKEGDKWLFINAQMVRSGFAYPYIISPNRRYEDFLFELQKKAIKEDLGIWSISQDIHMEKFYYTSDDHFHRPHCRQVKKIKEPGKVQNRREAFKKGLTPARCCKP